jgi:hypothetical protein
MNTVQYKGENSGRGLSPGLWADCEIDEIRQNPNKGYMCFDDFTEVPLQPTLTTQAAWGKWKAYATTGVTSTVNATKGGVLKFSSATDADEGCIATESLPFTLSNIAGSVTGKLWMEARIQMSSIADTMDEIFVGLAGQQTLATNVPITNTAATLADINCVGFHRTESDGNAINTTYKADSVTQVVVKTGVCVPVADTWLKLGLKFDPLTGKVTFYVNGVEQVDYVTAAIMASSAGTAFPNDVALGPTFAIRKAVSSTSTASLDWIAVAQEAY